MRILLPLLALTLAACTGAPVREGTPASANAGLAQAERAARLLAGEYSGGESRDRSQAAGLVRLVAEVERIGREGVSVRLTQFAEDGGERQFRLVFEPGTTPNRLNGRFAPIAPDGSARTACPLEIVLREGGFIARTSAESCRFGSGPDASALIKEIAHDGWTLVIGDRVVDPESGQARMSDRVLELQRLVRFEGWAGVRDQADSAWRLARPFRLLSDGVPVALQDAAGMPLEIELELAPHRVSEDRPAVFRLRVFEAASGDLIAQSWAALDSGSLGLALPRFQAGLARSGSPVPE
ncbi:MAG: hypothetical protein ACNA7E_02645 [Wenzhouxiangellaceae bacterium]